MAWTPMSARLPLPLSSLPQPIHPPFTLSGPPTTAPSPMAFSAHASRARDIGANNSSPAMNTFVMDPIDLWYPRNIISDGPQAKLTAAALAQMERWCDPVDTPQYRREWILHWVQTHTLPGCLVADVWVQPADELYESESLTYWSEMEVSEEDEYEKVGAKKEFRLTWKKVGVRRNPD
ncbi:hypothetical protein E4U34_003900 [Claviceps purpurea]|nr:hypothetical protein E4U34_003900 [Claviceps purpurea]